MRKGVDDVSIVLEKDSLKQPPRLLLVPFEVQNLAKVDARPLPEAFVVQARVIYEPGEDALSVVMGSGLVEANRLIKPFLW